MKIRKYYFIVKEKDVGNRIAFLILAGYQDLEGESHRYWHEESVTHQESKRFTKKKEAEKVAADIGAKVVSLPVKVYDWLLEQERLDDETFSN